MGSLFDDYAILAKSGLFDADYYVSVNPDVADLGLDPLMHYLEEGALEMRNPSKEFDAKSYMLQCKEFGENPENPLLHFIRFGGPGKQVFAPIQNQTTDAAIPVAQPDVLIGMDDAWIGNAQGSRISGAGWVVGMAPITEVRVAIGQTGVVARYGLLRGDVATAFPQFPKADQSGFTFTVDDLPTLDTSEPIDIVITVTTASGDVHSKSALTYVLATKPGGDDGAGDEPEPVGLPPLKLELDSSSIDEAGILRVEGWAVALSTIATVAVFVDDQAFEAVDYGMPREDVALAFPSYPDALFSGFVLAVDISSLGPGQKTVTIEAVTATGISRKTTRTLEFAPATSRLSTARDSEISVFCDLTELATDGWLIVEGWAICPAKTDEITIALDGVSIGNAEIGRNRPDVGNLFPGRKHARRSGFSFRTQIKGEISEGEHDLVIHVRGGDATAEIPVQLFATPAPQRVEVPSYAPAPAEDQLRLSIDRPLVLGDMAENPVRGNLEIAGWAVVRSGIAKIDVAIDGQFIVSPAVGIRRLDVHTLFGDWPGSLTSGFTALLSHRSLPVGRHRVTITLHDDRGNSVKSEFWIDVEQAKETSGPWSLRRRMPLTEANITKKSLETLGGRPSFSIVVTVPSNDDDAVFRARSTLKSLGAQIYENWQVIVAPAAAKRATVRHRVLQGFEAFAGRVGISENDASPPNPVPDPPDTSYVMVMQAGDELGCDALLEFAIASSSDRGAEFLYADDRRIDPATGKIEAFFKPDWSPDLLLSTDYIGRAWCARMDLMQRAGLSIAYLAKGNPYALSLRLSETARSVRHVRSVLFQHGDAPGSGVPASKSAQRQILKAVLKRRAIDAAIDDGLAPDALRVRRKLQTSGFVSIIIPTRATRGLIKTCIETLRGLTAYRNFEIVCIENIPADEQDWKIWLRANADTVIETFEPFNWSRFNNLAVAQSRGEFLLFLNDDTEITQPDWLDTLLSEAERPEIGVVGPQLLYPDARVQHAGMFLAGMGIARHAFRNMAADDPGYFGLARTQRDVIAVTGACLLTRRDTFERLGGFSETHAVVNNDLDYCLRVWRLGLRTLYTPHATLIHHELVSRGEIEDIYDASAFESAWKSVFVDGDPYFHPRLSKERDDYAIEWEPVQMICAGHPLFDRANIKNILAVKLDHIGDCVTALPAIRRLKQHFPDARLHVLSSRASKPVWTLEPAIDEVIEFDFFHARSGLGALERSAEDWAQLSDRLAPYGFDLAVDLRMHIDTRIVLQHTGAAYFAGFDYRGAFPWLDISLEWMADQAFFHKRHHIADDLVNLADAIAAAGETDRRVIVAAPSLPPDALSKVTRGDVLFEKPVVCVHPAAGNTMRQWPPEYFALLIDQLAAPGDVNVAVIGGPDEVELVETILAQIGRPDRVWSLAGKTKLGDLAAIISSCALFIGNNSGPHHIAAGLGVPTIGIHSGVTDAREWGPLGPNAAAVNRDMTCSPCYSAIMDECSRGFACMRQLRPGEILQLARRMLTVKGAQPKADRAEKPQRSKDSKTAARH
jgi:ADP-heptose:LPS heptosyltransferase/GT2 family glycosyltransferase